MSGAYLQDYTTYGYEISWMVITWGKTGAFCDNLPLLFTMFSTPLRDQSHSLIHILFVLCRRFRLMSLKFYCLVIHTSHKTLAIGCAWLKGSGEGLQGHHGPLVKNCSRNFDWPKSMALVNGGFLHYRHMMNFLKNLLRNCWSDFEIISQEFLR